MRWFVLAAMGALGAAAIPQSASAEPGILFVPNEDTVLIPVVTCPVSQSGQNNSALGCANVAKEINFTAFTGDHAGMMAGLQAALAPYDVTVTDVRPPEYVEYTMLVPQAGLAAENISYICGGSGINCSAAKRNDIGFLYGGTANCTNPDLVHSALAQVGRLAGLEGNSDPDDPMGYPPNFLLPATAFQDTCTERVNQFGVDDLGMEIELPFECTSLDHEDCPEPTEINSHADLMAYYGARVDDAEAPELANVSPVDGENYEDGDILMDVEITDSDPIVGVRWTMQSDALEAAGIEGGVLRRCTNDVCAGPGTTNPENWDGVFHETDGDHSFSLVGLPPGEYFITLEVADYHGNVAPTVTLTVTVGPAEGGTGGSTGGGDTGDGSTGGASTGGESTGDGLLDDTGEGDSTTGAGTAAMGSTSEGGDDLPDPEPGAETGVASLGGMSTTPDVGCACRSARPRPGGAWLLLGGLGLLLRRRRRQTSSAPTV